MASERVSEKRDVASGRSRACGALPISDVSSKMYTDRIVCFFCLRMNKRQATRPTRRANDTRLYENLHSTLFSNGFI